MFANFILWLSHYSKRIAWYAADCCVLCGFAQGYHHRNCICSVGWLRYKCLRIVGWYGYEYRRVLYHFLYWLSKRTNWVTIEISERGDPTYYEWGFLSSYDCYD